MAELSGRIHYIGAVETIPTRSGGELKKRPIVLTYMNGNRESYASFIVMVDSVNAEINGMSVGEEVSISYNIESREYNGKWYTDLKVWRIYKKTTPATTPTPAPSPNQSTPSEARKYQSDNHPANQAGFEDDLPF